MDNVIDRRVFYAGQQIFLEGSAGSEMYVLESGCVQIYKGVEGTKKVLAHIGPGSVFGEMALIDDSPRMASALALEETVCKVISKQTFLQNMKSVDPFMRSVIDILTKNVRSLSRTLDQIKK